jgi:hypothetical protein
MTVTHTTEVVFRRLDKKHRSEIIALFPYILDSGHYNQSYMRIGQHSGADYDHCITISSPASEAEYSDLKKELESIGYILKVLHRRSRSKWLAVRREQIALPGGIPFGKLTY